MPVYEVYITAQTFGSTKITVRARGSAEAEDIVLARKDELDFEVSDHYWEDHEVVWITEVLNT